MEVKNDIIMGGKYRDVITNFEGVATAFGTYITGCDQILLVPQVREDGKRPDGEWFDIARLEFIEDANVVELPIVEPSVRERREPVGAGQSRGRGSDISPPKR